MYQFHGKLILFKFHIGFWLWFSHEFIFTWKNTCEIHVKTTSCTNSTWTSHKNVHMNLLLLQLLVKTFTWVPSPAILSVFIALTIKLLQSKWSVRIKPNKWNVMICNYLLLYEIKWNDMYPTYGMRWYVMICNNQHILFLFFSRNCVTTRAPVSVASAHVPILSTLDPNVRSVM